MRKWVLLGGAIVTEVSASLSLKAALEHPVWFVVVVLGYASAFVLLAFVLRAGMPLGVAYGVWGALGVALTAGFAALLFGETLTPVMLAGIAMVMAGVLAVEIGSQRAASTKAAAAAAAAAAVAAAARSGAGGTGEATDPPGEAVR
ncbi:SMR family transporter [Herbiconiux sp.]|jgi:small multidrug resistance pump|uniref:DMT family transporter n=1 Tax=Herbiconiux sp. TaxID=1871186 RepID=UPI0025C49C7E|nr:SMR family transporter [Herbiconiux sp.]